MPLPTALADDGDDRHLPRAMRRYLERIQRIQDNATFDVFQHDVQAAALGDIDQIDAQTLADAARCSLEEELRLLDEGMARAGNSRAALELVARKVNILANINDRRITRRFGR